MNFQGLHSFHRYLLNTYYVTDTRLGNRYNKDEQGHMKAMERVKMKHFWNFYDQENV